MIADILYKNKIYKIDLSKPLDISIPLRAGYENVNAWYAPPVSIDPVRMDNWIGDVNQGGSVNFRNVFFNPHAHGTHTECVGHISRENISLNMCLKEFFFGAQLVSVAPAKLNGDLVITKKQLEEKILAGAEAIIIRTLPNDDSKCVRQYSNTNPAYIHHEAIAFLVEAGVNHLLIDLPSVDKEKDGGKLLAHHAFWKYPGNTRTKATISELIYANNSIADGFYFLNLQITSLENDASPSKPVLYKPVS